MKYPAIEQYCKAEDELISENGSHIANVLDF